MALKKMVMGVEVELTPEEEQEVLASWAEEDNRKAEQEKLFGYRTERAEAYPPLADQLDMIYKDKINGTNLWAEMIASVKTEYPKPS